MYGRYNRAYQISRKVAFLYLRESFQVDDITQLTMMQLYLNEDKVAENKLYNWIFVVTKNFCMQYFKKVKQVEALRENVRKVAPNYIDFDVSEVVSGIDDYKEFNLDNYDFLSEQEKTLFKLYFIDKKDLSEISRDYKIKKKALSNKINTIFKEIKQYHIIETEPFVFDPVVGTKLYRNLSNLLSILKKVIEENNFIKFKHYFRECIIHNSILSIHIKVIKKYRIEIESENSYKLLVAYLNFGDEYKFFMLRFKLLNDRKISVLEIPIMPKRVLLYNPEYIEGEKGLKMVSDHKGRHNNRFGPNDVIIKKKIVTVVQTEDHS